MGGVKRESSRDSESQQSVARPARLPLPKDVHFHIHFWHEGCCPLFVVFPDSHSMRNGGWKKGETFHVLTEYRVPGAMYAVSISQHPCRGGDLTLI